MAAEERRDERRTAHKYSNVGDRERLRQATASQRAAPTTVSGLGAESSHRGDRRETFANVRSTAHPHPSTVDLLRRRRNFQAHQHYMST